MNFPEWVSGSGETVHPVSAVCSSALKPSPSPRRGLSGQRFGKLKHSLHMQECKRRERHTDTRHRHALILCWGKKKKHWNTWLAGWEPSGDPVLYRFCTAALNRSAFISVTDGEQPVRPTHWHFYYRLTGWLIQWPCEHSMSSGGQLTKLKQIWNDH